VTRAAFVVVFLAAAAHADPPPTKLTMRQTDGTNLHIAGNRGAIHWNADVTVTVELLADHKLEAVAAGSRSEHNLYAGGQRPSYTTVEETKFRIRWTGTWAQSGDRLALDLALADDRCTHQKTSTGVPTEVLACRPAARHTRLACSTQAIELSAPKRKVDAWSCAPTTSLDLGESPPWLLGKTICIDVPGSHLGGASFRKC